MFLAKSSMLDNRALSLYGFSLGGVVSFYCMRIMKRLNDYHNPKVGRILCDMNLWAAAYVMDLSRQYSEIREKSENCTVANGNLNNCYCPRDGALKLGMTIIYKNQTAVGLKPIFEDIKKEDEPTCKKAINYFIDFPFPAHADYGPKAYTFLHKIKDGY